MTDTNATLAQEFYDNFQARRHEFSLRLKGAKADELHTLSLELAQLRKQLVDATSFLPSYDQRQYEIQLKEWEQSLDQVRSSYAPKSRFAFKRKESNMHTAAATISKTPDVTEVVPAPSAYLTLSSHSNARLSFSSLPSPRDLVESDMTIADLDNCIVDLVGTSGSESRPVLPALHIRNITNTILLLPIIKGSVLLHNLRRCVIAVGCHQFRMHTSTDVDVHLSIPSSPVIEHCSRIRFAQYPTCLSDKSLAVSANNPFSVQDFSHIRSTPSPNWSVIPDSSTLETLLLGSCPEDEQLKEALDRLLPPADRAGFLTVVGK